MSAKDTKRPALQRLLNHARDGDAVHVHELSRLGRSLKDLLEILGTVVSKSTTITFHKESLTFGDSHKNPYSKFLLHMLSSPAIRENLWVSHPRVVWGTPVTTSSQGEGFQAPSPLKGEGWDGGWDSK